MVLSEKIISELSTETLRNIVSTIENELQSRNRKNFMPKKRLLKPKNDVFGFGLNIQKKNVPYTPDVYDLSCYKIQFEKISVGWPKMWEKIHDGTFPFVGKHTVRRTSVSFLGEKTLTCVFNEKKYFFHRVWGGMKVQKRDGVWYCKKCDLPEKYKNLDMTVAGPSKAHAPSEIHTENIPNEHSEGHDAWSEIDMTLLDGSEDDELLSEEDVSDIIEDDEVRAYPDSIEDF